jgi:hypothetical protein
LGAVVFYYRYYDFSLFEPDWFENHWLFLLSQGIRGFLIHITMDFPMHVFLSPEILDTRPVPEMERLSTLYNADVGLYMLANKVLEYR